jgi:hypothetical protein
MNRTVLVSLCSILLAGVVPAKAAPDAKAEVLAAEEAFTQAKLKNDVAALERLVADDYLGINHWGAMRDKKEVIELFRTFNITSLKPSHVTVKVDGDTATIQGMMCESNEANFLFMRTYVRRNSRWLLLSSIQMIPIYPDGMKPFNPEVLFR